MKHLLSHHINHHKREESDITTLIRPIYKNEDYEILLTSKTAIKNGIKKQYIELYLKKKRLHRPKRKMRQKYRKINNFKRGK